MLPTVITSSVIRGADKGDSHGGVYLIDLEREKVRQVLDWDRAEIDWQGRGGDRGLRGIAIYDERIYMAASDEIFVFDQDFKLVGSHRHALLKHCHETFLEGSQLYITSTGYNAVIVLDLERADFVAGYQFRFPNWKQGLYRRGVDFMPAWRRMQLDTPEKYALVGEDSLHINHVFVEQGRLYFSGTRIRHLFEFDFERLRIYGRLPRGGHNARPFEGGTLLNDTASDRLAILDRRGKLQEAYAVRRYAAEKLNTAGLPERVARQGFARGLLSTNDGHFVVGSSPATLNVFRRGAPQLLKSVNIAMDLRNAIHGLEIWPFGLN